ncbi:MAG TPA: hypothetical protein DDW49_02955 [Deltaproteobacteria bacterium]|nr:MAG: hypothetical protein A2048_05210 [Deltaproteobacteria bacterium GWA2_45_12]HBF12339.1 hypothetical protein [Deltaproteobacteria bacterium]
MKYINYVPLRGVFVFFVFPLVVGCGGGLGQAPVRSSGDAMAATIDSNNSAFPTTNPSEGTVESLIENQSAQENEEYAVAPSNKRMDGVEYFIQQDLKEANSPSTKFSKKKKKKRDLPELKSIYDDDGSKWNPERGYDIPYVYNDQVQKWINVFTGNLRGKFAQWINRGSHVVPIMQEVLREYDMPTDLVYLSMIESGFNMHAYSHAHAAGAWQFIRSTGKMYGLECNHFIDERRDLMKATHAAARHLKDLHNLYGDWYLAFAAYNAGAGKVNGAIRKSRSTNFWTLAQPKTRYLRQETKDYVPRILAAATVVKNYKKYGFSRSLFDEPLRFDGVTIPDATDIDVIAKASGSSIEEISKLNPSLMLGVTPPDKHYTVYLPDGHKDNFERNYADIPKQDRVHHVFYKVRKKENLATIGKRYGVSANVLASANDMRLTERLVPGSYVRIPKQGESTDKFIARASLNAPAMGVASSGATYRVRKGDTLGRIASHHGVSVAQLKKWNGLSGRGVIRAGQKLKVSAQKLVAYQKPKVQPKVSEASTAGIQKEVTVSSVIEGNGLGKQEEPSLPSAAEVEGPVAMATEPLVEAKPAVIFHSVQKGDTLWDLSKRYGVSVNQIKQWNGLQNNKLKTRQQLKINS